MGKEKEEDQVGKGAYGMISTSPSQKLEDELRR